MLEPTGCFEAVEHRALPRAAPARTDSNHLGESALHVLERLKLLFAVGDLRLSAFSHAVAGIDGLHPSRAQCPNLMQRASQILRVPDAPQRSDRRSGADAI
jgi:hypothetical protein